MTLPKRFVLLEADASWQAEVHMEVRWDSFDVAGQQISIPLHVEDQSLEIKSEYLRMIYEIGRKKIKGKSLTEHLKLFDNLSLWWLTTIVEKNSFLYESIYKVFKLRVLEKLYLSEGCDELVYCGSDLQLDEVLNAWCQELGHPYRKISSGLKSEKNVLLNPRTLFDKLPKILQVIAWLIRRWWLRFRHLKELQEPADKSFGHSETIVTFFPNIDLQKANHGKFYSRYWGKLHELLDNSEKNINWVWFYSDKDVSFHQAVKIKNSLNQKSNGRQKYFLLEEFLGYRSFVKSLFLYLKIFFSVLGLGEVRDAFCFSGSKMNYFPILKQDWDSSIFGVMGIERIFQGVMFDSMAQHLPEHNWGLYTWENQPWELALISAWRRHYNNIEIIAYEHSSVRPLDLQLFMDSQTYKSSDNMAFPVPDILGVNGSVAFSIMQESGFPIEKLERVEALRFFTLKGKYGSERKFMKESERTLLVVTGVIPCEAFSQLKFLHEASQQQGLRKYERIIIKPHPGLPIDSTLIELDPEFNYEVVTEPISNYWSQVDVVYCANSSGASLEAAWLGIPLIVTSAIDSMNLNPLFGFNDLHFVTKTSQLMKALEKPGITEIPDDYFFLDENLESWKKILKL